MTKLLTNLINQSRCICLRQKATPDQHTLSEIIDDQVESGLWYDVNKGRQNLQGPLTPAKHHQIVLDELFSELKRAGGDIYKVLQLSLKSQEGEKRKIENLKQTCILLS